MTKILYNLFDTFLEHDRKDISNFMRCRTTKRIQRRFQKVNLGLPIRHIEQRRLLERNKKEHL